MSDLSDHHKKTKNIKSLFEKLTTILAPEPDSQSDLLDVIHIAHDRKLIDADCLAMIEGIFDVYQLAARDIMIPRSFMLTIDANQPIELWMNTIIESGHSRYPVIDSNPEKIIGILYTKDLVKYYEKGCTIREILRPAVFIPESKKLNVLLRDFKNTRNHLAIVIDEFGNISGLVTIEDILEEIVGEIIDENENDHSHGIIAIKQEDGSTHWKVPASIEMEDLNEELGLNLEDNRVDTIGGYVMTHLGYVPHIGEVFDLDNLHFEVIRADAKKLQTLLISRLPSSQNNVSQ